MTDQSQQRLKLAGTTGAIFLLFKVVFRSGSSDMHFQDTYIVMDSAVQVLCFIVISLFLASLIAAVFCKFKVTVYNRALIFSLFLLFFVGLWFFAVFF